jgi:hypothetical protein
MPDLSDPRYLITCINNDMNDLIEVYLTEMNKLNMNNNGKNLLNVLGAMQACLQELYKKGLGEKDTAMLYYGIADRIVGNIVDEERNAKS